MSGTTRRRSRPPSACGSRHRAANATVRGPVRPLTEEIDERTALGEVYMAALLRAQLRLGAAVLPPRPCCSAACRCCSSPSPPPASLRVWRCRCPGSLLGVLVYPVVLLAARYYVRHSERIERDFADLVARR